MNSTSLLFGDDNESSATISECGLYRYDLMRTWVEFHPRIRRVAFVMLNPSTADSMKPDPTMTRCLRYAKDWGFESLVIVNLFSLRSTDPDELQRAADPVGPENDKYIRRWVSDSELVVCGWGAHPFARRRIDHVLGLIRESGKVPHCLARTKEGHPGHPLFLRKDLKPVPMEAMP